MTILVLCEKDEQGQKVAQGLGLRSRGRGIYSGDCGGRAMELQSASGHLMEPMQPDEARPDMNWHDPHSLLPVPDRVGLILTDRGKKLLPQLKKAIQSADEVWLATDPDREGEAIGRNILAYANYSGPLKRLWLDKSLEPVDVRRAAEALRDGNEQLPLYRAQQARQMADWLWQLLTRGYTMLGRRGGMGSHLGQGKGPASVVSVGRVQTPTLAMVVERDRAIESHVERQHYQVALGVSGVSAGYSPTLPVEGAKGVWIDDKGKPLFLDRSTMETFGNAVTEAGVVRVETAETGVSKRQPPLPHHLNTLQAELSKTHGMDPGEVLQIADQLRLDGYLTYPRTDHGELPVSLYNPEDMQALLTSCAAVPDLAEPAETMQRIHVSGEVETLGAGGGAGGSGGVKQYRPACFTEKSMEHHGIIPTAKAPDWSGWNEKQRRVYHACAFRFVQALYPPAVYETLKLELHAPVTDPLEREPARFTASPKRIMEPGWLVLSESDVETPLPAFVVGADHPVEDVRLREQKTRPPRPYTVHSLLEAMRSAGRAAEGEDARLLNRIDGIGRPSTRHTMPEKLAAREAIAINGKKVVRSTERGRDLVDGPLPAEAVDVATTAQWERMLDEIAKAPSDDEAVRLRDEFMGAQRRHVTEYLERIAELCDQLPPPASNNAPTKKMLQTARKLAKERGIALPAEAKERFDACRTFLDEHLGGSRPPTEKMRAQAERVAEALGVEPNEALGDFDACKAFLDEYMPLYQASRKPSDAMLKALAAVERRTGESAPAEARERFDACKAFLDAHPR